MEWSPYNKCLYYATLEVDPFHGNHFRAKLWSAGEQGRTEPMMDKMRCWSPTLSKQHQLAVIKNDQGEARLMVGKVGQKIEDQWLTPPGSSYKTPRFSPNGESLAVVASQHEQQDICLIDIKSNSLTAILGWDQAFDLDPTWSPDGKWLYFISDRSGGVFQLYVWSIETAALYKISHAQFGVFQPAVSPDGQQICLVEFQANHQEQLFVAPLDPSTWEKIEHPKQMVGWPKTKQVKELASTKGTDEETYNAWPYIWPTFWIPAFGFNQQGLLMGIFSAQRDPLEFHEWQGSLLYSLKSGWPYGYLTYSNQYWPITWSMTIAREATNQLIVIQDEVETVDWGIREAVNFKAQTTIWHHRSRDWSTTSSAGLTIGWNTYRSEVTTLLPQVLYVQPVLSFGHGFSGPKDFFTIKGWSAKFGGKFSLNHEWSTGQAVSGSGSLYWPGLADHHGWRLSLRGGHQLGDFPENNGQYVPYGYQQDMNALDYQSTATLSYRFPIGYIDQGWAEWPVFLNDLWLALTYEQGLSWNKEWPWSEISNHSTSSLSLEGTLDVTLFWYLTGAVNSKLIYRLSQQDFVGELDLGVRF